MAPMLVERLKNLLKKILFTKTQRYSWPAPELDLALKPLESRVLTGYWLETARLVLIWGLAAAAAVSALAWVLPVPPTVAAVAGISLGVGLLVLTLRWRRRPDALDVMRLADAMGLNGAAATAFRLLESGARDPWSGTARQDALQECRRMGGSLAGRYPTVVWGRSWSGVAMLAVIFLTMVLLPNPLQSYWADAREERRALEAASLEAKVAVERVQDLKINGEDVLPEEVKKQIAGLPRTINNAASRREAADHVERARWQLDEARAVVGSTANRDLQRLAGLWGRAEDSSWQKKMAQALDRGDEREIRRTAAEFSSLANKTSAAEKKDLAASLFSAAATVGDEKLRRALNEAAGAALGSDNQAAGATDSGGGQDQSGAEADAKATAAGQALADALAGAAAEAGAGDALGNASTMLASLAGGLAGAGSSGSFGLAQAGSGTGSSGGGAGSGSAAAAAGGSGSGSSGGSSASGAGSGAGSGNSGSDGSGGNSGGNGNSGSGNGSGTGNGTGQGGQGSGAGRTGGGLDLIYTPFLPDAGGEQSNVSGQVRQGERGNDVSLNRSPTTLGAVRPYNEVYGHYMAEAHESLSRSPLPPDMENLVWQYFTSLNQNQN